MLQEKIVDTYLKKNDEQKQVELRINIHMSSILRTNIHGISTYNNNTLYLEVEILEVEDKEEFLVVDKAKLYVIIVGSLDTFPRTT